MARTYRDVEYCGSFRNPQTRSAQVMEVYAVDQLREVGVQPNNRLKVRANPRSGAIANAWDDLPVAGLAETYGS